MGSDERGYRLVRDGKQHRVADVAGLRRFLDTSEARARLTVHFTSDSTAWFTPAHIIARVRAVLGAIDLDPASCEQANLTVQARQFFTLDDDGLSQDWRGKVFLNPPYSDQIGRWGDALLARYAAGDVTEAIALLPARPDTQWLQPLFAYPRCWVRGRLKFGDSTDSAPFPSVLVYLGPRSDVFQQVMADLGAVDLPAPPRSAADALTPGEITTIWRVLNGEACWQRQARQSWQRFAAQYGIALGVAAGEAA